MRILQIILQIYNNIVDFFRIFDFIIPYSRSAESGKIGAAIAGPAYVVD